MCPTGLVTRGDIVPQGYSPSPPLQRLEMREKRHKGIWYLGLNYFVMINLLNQFINN